MSGKTLTGRRGSLLGRHGGRLGWLGGSPGGSGTSGHHDVVWYLVDDDMY